DDGPVGEAWIEVRLGLGDAHLAHLAPETGQPVQRARRDAQHEDRGKGSEPWAREDPEEAEAFEHVDHRWAELPAQQRGAVIPGVEILELALVRPVVVQRERRDLAAD